VRADDGEHRATGLVVLRLGYFISGLSAMALMVRAAACRWLDASCHRH
jgi:hypothetical protein